MAAWYLTRDGTNRYGPYDDDQLRQLAASGRVLPTDMLWREGTPQWVSAASVSGLLAAPSLAAMPSPAPPVAEAQPHCPRCQSPDTIKVSLVYERETVHSQSSGLFTGFGVSSGGTGALLGTSQHSVVQQTQMAKRLQPPQPARLSAGLKWALAGVILLGLASLGGFIQASDGRSGKSPVQSFLLALACTGGAILCGMAFFRGKQKVDSWNAEEFPKLLEAWEAAWLCQKCGTTYVPAPRSKASKTESMC